MNKIFGLVLLNVFGAGPEGKSCRIDLNGYVTMEQVVNTPEGTQRFIANIGHESWDDPYKFRKICEKLKTEIGDQVNERWENYGCDGKIGIQRKVIIANLSPEGQKQMGDHNLVLAFTPIEPINNAFLRHYEDPACDPL